MVSCSKRVPSLPIEAFKRNLDHDPAADGTALLRSGARIGGDIESTQD